MRLLIMGLLLVPFLLNAQFQTGWRTDDYAGINSAFVNPALPARTPYGWDINLGEASIFLAQNYAYLGQTSIPQLLRLRDQEVRFVTLEGLPSDFDLDDNNIAYDYIQDDRYFGQQLTSIMGPSFSVRVAPQTRVGIFTRWQTLGGTRGLEEDVGYYRWRSIPNNQVFTLDKFRLSGAAWLEAGLNITQGIYTNSGVLHIGVSLRRLWGQRAAYFVSQQDFGISKYPNQVGVEGSDFAFEAGFTNNISNDDFTNTPGRGWGADLGILYQLDLGDGFNRWEFGLAVLDIGGLKFTDSERHRFSSDDLAATLTDNYEGLDAEQSIPQAAAQLSEDIFGSESASRFDDEFAIALPTTISAQATYRFTEWAKVEANLIAGISPAEVSLTRNTLIALTPRIDRHWWSIGMPVSLYAMNDLRLGLAARLGPVFIGTDQLGSFLKSDQLTGGDFYVGVKLHPLGLNRNGGKNGKRRGGRRGKGREVDCYKF